MHASTETLLGDVRSALHRRRIWPHSPDKDHPGWRAQPTPLDGIPAVTLTWHGIQGSAHNADLGAGFVASGWLLHLERHLERDFIVGRLYEERPHTQPGRALVALIALRASNEQTTR
ncbi:hypothetical protein ACFXKR_32250 [Streptomyces violascens]|uniref:hypothetical protein n=1 Tax=Streptomyces violascens TaxID=67381 RepID=UPI0036AA898F